MHRCACRSQAQKAAISAGIISASTSLERHLDVFASVANGTRLAALSSRSVVNLRGSAWPAPSQAGYCLIAGKRQVTGIGFSLAKSAQKRNATNEGERGDRRGNREQPIEDGFGALHDCASGMVFNRGEHIGGAGEGEPITSAIDMRDSAKAAERNLAGGQPRLERFTSFAVRDSPRFR